MYDFADFLPNEAALKALNKLIAYGVLLGKIKKNYNVIGHRQVRDTECPGETFYKLVVNLPRWTANPKPHIRPTTTIKSIDNIVEENNKANVIL